MTTELLIALGTLTLLEIVLGIDNIVFISILAARLPKMSQAKARNIGLGSAILVRVLLLFSITWIMQLTADLFSVAGNGISGRDLILIGGGLFLLAKSSLEIHHNLEGEDVEDAAKKKTGGWTSIMIQITIVNVVFSLDSVITAVGMTDVLWVMVAAVVISGIFMLVAANPVANFVERHPTVKVLALSFLILIGMSLIGEGLDMHIPKGYVYFAMAFSVAVEMINLRVRGKHKPVDLKRHMPTETRAA